MMGFIYVLLALLVVVLVAGVVVMGMGGKIDKQYSNKLMQARVMIQALIVAIIAIAAFALK